MKLTRVAPAAAVLVVAACAALPAPRAPVRLEVRAPKLPVSESTPSSSRPTDPVEAAVLDRINKDRADANLPPVAWDPAAALVAKAYTTAQVAEGTSGHFLTDGMAPYARTGFAGIFGMGSENAVAWHTTGKSFSDSAKELALSGHEDMMRETPPNDGHRRTILDPEATHVGVGYALHGGSFRMAEEFLARRLAELTIQKEGDALSVRGRTQAGRTLSFVTIAQEPRPEAADPRAGPLADDVFLPRAAVGVRSRGPQVDPGRRHRDRRPHPAGRQRRVRVPLRAREGRAVDVRLLRDRRPPEVPARRRRGRVAGARLAVITVLAVGAEAEPLAAFGAAHPSVEIVTANGAEDALERLARNRRIDAVLILAQPDAAETARLVREEDPGAPPSSRRRPPGPSRASRAFRVPAARSSSRSSSASSGRGDSGNEKGG